MKAIFFNFQRFSGGGGGGVECVLVQLLLIQALFSMLYQKQGYLLYGDMIILCVG